MTTAHILIAEAQTEHLHRLAEELTARGHRVATASDADAALAQIKRQPPDLVLLDDRFPGLNPEQLFQYFQDHELDSFAVVASEQTDLDRAMDVVLDGAYAVLAKPVAIDRLIAVLEKGLENKEAYRYVVGLARELSDTNAALNREKAALRESSEKLRFLYALSLKLSATLDSAQIVRIVSRQLAQVVSSDVMALFTDWDPKIGPRLYSDRPLTDETAAVAAGLLKHQMDGQDAGSDWERIEPEDGEVVVDLPPERWTWPLVAAGRPIGIMGLFFRNPVEKDRDLTLLLESVALKIALALFNAQQHELALEMATHDALTGLLNRGAFNAVVDTEFGRFERYQAPVSLIMLDLDHFKAVNDRFGHKAGDETLKFVAQVLAGCVRHSDVAARYGGEEFAVLLPNTKQAEAVRLAERIEERLRSERLYLGGVSFHQTASQGVAGTDRHAVADVESLLRLADQALYRAKAQGRDTIVSAGALRSVSPKKESAHAFI